MPDNNLDSRLKYFLYIFYPFLLNGKFDLRKYQVPLNTLAPDQLLRELNIYHQQLYV